MNLLTRAGYLAGIVWTIGFFIRYFILWNNTSEGIIFVAIGLGICFATWSAQKILDHNLELLAVSDHIEDTLEDKR